MAAPAVGPEFTVVDVVRAMAAAASVDLALHRVEWASVAGIAGHVKVCAVELEVGSHAVIELPEIPGDGVVTVAADTRQVAAMRIVLPVAADTVVVGIGEHPARMTFVAVEVLVFAEQRERGQVVRESRRLFPTRFVMTVLTSVPLLPLVGVVLEVAGVADRLQLGFENRIYVTILAGDLFVRAV